MRILLLTHFFPPYDHIGSARTGKTAKYLELFGHDVRVIAARDPMTPFAQMPLEIPYDHVVYTKWISIFFRIDIALNRLAQKWWKRKSVQAVVRAAPPAGSFDETPGLRPSTAVEILKRIRDSMRAVFYFPDAYAGWIPFGHAAGRRLLARWRPDVILASGAPAAAFIIASKLSKEFGVPWVAELRDLWIDNHLYPHPMWRRRLEAKLEKATISSASGLITVSEPLAENLRARFSADVEVVYNGFDPGDHGGGPPRSRSHRVTIAYTGWVYPQQTLEPLFAAMQQLGERAEDIRIVFYRSDEPLIRNLATRHQVGHLVETRAGVSFMESLRVQREADVLLYLSWNDPEHAGIFSGKLLQYFGARRPILAVGRDDGVPARLISERGIGFASADPDQIAPRLVAWVEEKKRIGVIEAVPEEAVLDFSRENQTRRLASFLARVNSRARAPRQQSY